MTQDVVDINHFYATPVGGMAARVINQHMKEHLTDVSKKKILVIGFGIPYMPELQQRGAEIFAAMPSWLGAIYWPEGEKNRCAICHEKALPFADQSFDHVILVHAVEHAHSLENMMKEAWRVLKGSGQVLVIAPNRGSIWSKTETTPFAHGRPFSNRQILSLLKDHRFVPLHIGKALFYLPWNACFEERTASWLEKWGRYIFLSLGGVIVASATKRLYAVNPTKGATATWQVPVMKPRSVSSG